MNVLQTYLEAFTECLGPEVARRIVEFSPNPQTLERLDCLRGLANEGALSSAEQEEYKAFVEAVDFMGLLKAHASRLLESK